MSLLGYYPSTLSGLGHSRAVRIPNAQLSMASYAFSLSFAPTGD
jgi:hypothetical protein